MRVRNNFIFISATFILFLMACGLKAVPPEAMLDTPLHHVVNGKKLLKSGKIEAAYYEFNRAKELDSTYVPAHIGLGLVSAHRGDFANGLKAMKTARRYAMDDKLSIEVCVGYMRVYIIGKEAIDSDWLKAVKKEFETAKSLNPGLAEPYFYMGLAYKMSYQFDKSADQFKKVIEINGSMAKEADAEFAIIQKIKKAMPESINGKRIAIIKQISRADVAALFIEELKIDELLDKRAPKKSDASLKSPETNSQTGEHVKDIRVTDIDDHELRADMQAAINIGIRGLQPFPDNKFRPDQIITRAEYAIMIEDILIKITGENELATRYIDRSSPFPDLHNDLPYFNAVMTCASRGIMTANDMRTGEFDPFGPISGADALLGIRALKTQL